MDDKELLEAIEHAVRTGAKSLDLSEQSLTALPPEIGQMIGLTEVDLGANQLPIPPEILDDTGNSADFRPGSLTWRPPPPMPS